MVFENVLTWDNLLFAQSCLPVLERNAGFPADRVREPTASRVGRRSTTAVVRLSYLLGTRRVARRRPPPTAVDGRFGAARVAVE